MIRNWKATTGLYVVELKHDPFEQASIYGGDPREWRREAAKREWFDTVERLLLDGREYYVKVNFTRLSDEEDVISKKVDHSLMVEVEYMNAYIYLLRPTDCQIGEKFIAIPSLPDTVKHAIMYGSGAKFKPLDRAGKLWERIL